MGVFVKFLLVVSLMVNLSSCWDYECKFDGERHAHEIGCNLYYECSFNGFTFLIYLKKCPVGYSYNGTINSCYFGDCNIIEPSTTTQLIQTSTSEYYEPTTEELISPTEDDDDFSTSNGPIDETSTDGPIDETSTNDPIDESTTDGPIDETSTNGPIDESTTDGPIDETSTNGPIDESTTDDPVDETTTNVPITTTTQVATRPPFICRQTGYFPDPYNCNEFHQCNCRETGCEDNVLRCPVGYVFCEEYSSCARESAYCLCINRFFLY